MSWLRGHARVDRRSDASLPDRQPRLLADGTDPGLGHRAALEWADDVWHTYAAEHATVDWGLREAGFDI